ncbi:ATPase get3a [Asimina triloba]
MSAVFDGEDVIDTCTAVCEARDHGLSSPPREVTLPVSKLRSSALRTKRRLNFYFNSVLRFICRLEGKAEILSIPFESKMASEDEILEGTMRNILDQESLKWVFVGGKGGVGKTTCSSILSILLSKVRSSVLIISTDPAHNLSDAFQQRFTKTPTLVNGFNNLYAMEVDPNVENDELPNVEGMDNFVSELANAIPGIDEAMSFAEMLKPLPHCGGEVSAQGRKVRATTSMARHLSSKCLLAILLHDQGRGHADRLSLLTPHEGLGPTEPSFYTLVQTMDYSVIVFDTAPTGHTLRLLQFPSTLEKGLEKLMAVKNRFGGVLSQMTRLFGMEDEFGEDAILGKLESMKDVIEQVNKQFKDPDLTTFVCVCIPEFLSLYETERLVQELAKFEIDTHNIIINQVLFDEEAVESKLLKARMQMQKKYIGQFYMLYDDFHITKLPLLPQEVCGTEALEAFSTHFLTPYQPGLIKGSVEELEERVSTLQSQLKEAEEELERLRKGKGKV